MLRMNWVVGLAAIGISAAAAQSDPIATRRALMKANGDHAKVGSAMAKGEAPFDLDKAKAVFATFIDAANKMPFLFPENSKTGGETSAAPKIWEDMPDFKARFQKLGTDAKAAADSTGDLDGFKAAFSMVAKNCGGCHEIYRVKKS